MAPSARRHLRLALACVSHGMVRLLYASCGTAGAPRAMAGVAKLPAACATGLIADAVRVSGVELQRDALGVAGGPEGTHLDMLRHNINTIVSARAGQPPGLPEGCR